MQMLNPLAAFRVGVVGASFFHPASSSLALTWQRAYTGFSNFDSPVLPIPALYPNQLSDPM